MNYLFQKWAARSLSAASLNSYMSGLRSIETNYGDLDQLYDEDRFDSVFRDLTFSSYDERTGAQNPSRIPISTNLYKQLSNLRSHLRFYVSFKESDTEVINDSDDQPSVLSGSFPDPMDRTLSLERDLQAALRANPNQIEPGLSIRDGGVEKSVPSGQIDIFAGDSEGRDVVIELKAVTARREVLGQIAAYMADIQDQTGKLPRGILIAPDFDAKLISGARMISGLTLKRYSFSFSFSDV
ncbi:endonuclease NucS domain-containing protein [Pararhodobacter sp.]|uniref:endonuclease NucS domain-containing protein n=1 Tax=Pararhodobacter sp. TaxID=2127056 RepID=UPI002AFFF66B|nr:endonuclease NucS domain-containing protein [Pararhodobacter sp.]